MCDQMGELENYTFLESSDHANNGKKLFFHYVLGNTFSPAIF